jgi:hypothetical protein
VLGFVVVADNATLDILLNELGGVEIRTKLIVDAVFWMPSWPAP